MLLLAIYILLIFRHLLGITKLDKETNQCIRERTGVQNTVKEIKEYQEKWLQHVQRMDTNRIQKQALQYKPKGRRNIGRRRKRWRDQLHLEDQGTGNTPNLSWTWWWRYILLLISFAIFVSYNIYSFQCTAFFHDVTVNVKVAPHKFQKKSVPLLPN